MTKEIVRHSTQDNDNDQIPTNKDNSNLTPPIRAQAVHLRAPMDAYAEAGRLERLADRATVRDEPSQNKHKRS